MTLLFLSCKVKAWGKTLMGGHTRDQAVLVFIPIHIHLRLAGEGYDYSPILWWLTPGKGHVTRTWLSWDCWPVAPTQRWHCSGKIPEVKHPEKSMHGPLTPQAGREHKFPHWSTCVFMSARAFRGLLEYLFPSVSQMEHPQGKDYSGRPANCLAFYRLSHVVRSFPQPFEINIITIPTLQMRKFRHTDVK